MKTTILNKIKNLFRHSDVDIINNSITDIDIDDVKIVFPHYLNVFIKKPCNIEMASVLLQMTNKENGNIAEIRRAITISAALFKIEIHKDIILIDSRSRNLYRAILPQLRTIKIEFDPDKNTSAKTLDIYTYKKQLTRIGALILTYARDESFPHIDVFVKAFTNSSLKNKTVYRKQNASEIKSLITAFGYLTNTEIPASYVNYNELTAALIADPLINKKIRIEQK